jgi:hypothetical protein
MQRRYFFGLCVLFACAPQPSDSLGPRPHCISEGRAVDFLRSITREWLADSARRHEFGWKGEVSDIQVVSGGPICSRAAKVLAQTATPTRLDSVAVVRAGNRYTAVRTGQVDVIVLLDEDAQKIHTAVLQ